MRPEFALPHGASPPGNGIPQNHYSPIKNKMKKHFANEPSPCKRWRRWSRKNTGIFASLHKQVTIGVLSCSMSILLLTTPEDIFAQSFETDSVKELDISEITVTGNILPPTRTAVLPIPILDRTDAAVAPLQTIEAALRLSPSVDVRERGSKGVQADISIRGGSFDQTLIMLNGVDFTDARTGHQSHSLPIDLDIVSGISVEDGTAGIGAFAGAVNIRTQPLRPTYLRAEISGGQFGYAYGNLSGAITHKRFTLFGAGSYRASDGYTRNTDFKNYNAFVRVGYDSRRAGYFDGQAGWQTRNFGANGFYSLKYPDQYEATRTFLSSIRWQKSIGRLFLESSVSYRKNFDRFEMVRGDASKIPFNYHNTDRIGASLRSDYSWRWGTTSLHGDYRYDHIYSSVLGKPLHSPRKAKGEKEGLYTQGATRHSGDIRLRHTKQIGKFDIEGSVGSVFSSYETTPVWSLSGGYRPIDGLHIGIAAVQSMRLPTFTDLYYTATGYISNPNLKPEKATTYRLRATYQKKNWRTAAEVYYRDGRDIIDWVQKNADSEWESQQLTRLGTLGIEWSGGYYGNGFLQQATLAYGYMTTDKKSGDYISKYALDYMRHKATACIGIRFLRYVTLTVTAGLYDRNGNYIAADGQQTPYRTYALLDARIAWERRHLRIYIDGNNITATRYCDFGGLKMPEGWFTGGLVVTY